jgi:ribose/xylose/arabinose/galactoside ABC-type transport system permease subunit
VPIRSRRGAKGSIVGTGVVEVGPEGGKTALRGTLGWAWTVLGPFLGLIAIVALFGVLTRSSGQFLTAFTWRTIAVQTVVVGAAALGMTLIMISGGIDLSVGSVVALVTVAVGLAIRDAHLPLPLALAVGLLVGGLCGLWNGALITGLGVVPFIITLGSLKIFRGLAKWLADSTQVYTDVEGQARWFSEVLALNPRPRWLVVAPGVWVLLGLSVLVALLLRYSLLGRYIYAVGSNEATARLCGIRVPAVKLAVYGLGGLLTGLAGVMQFFFLHGEGDPTVSDGLELQVIAAVVIGGGSLSGGEGTVLGTLIGCLIMSVLASGCSHVGIPDATRDVIIGAIIVTAVVLDRLRRRGACVGRAG